MDGYRGTVVCDALKTHEAGARGNDAIQLAGCWAHVYRKFEEAAPDHPEAQLALKWIGELYAIDERAEGDAERRAELRRTESATVIGTMKTWLWQQAVLKTLSIGHAAAYVVANWDRLTRFLQDARIPLGRVGRWRGDRRTWGVAGADRFRVHRRCLNPRHGSVSSARSWSLVPEQGPFPPPELPGFAGTTGPSAICLGRP